MGAIKSYMPEPCQPCCMCCAGAEKKDEADEGEIRVPVDGLKKTI